MAYSIRRVSIIFLLPLLLSCSRICTEGTGAAQTEKRNLEQYDAISLDIPAEVTLMRGDSFSLIITAPENLLEKIQTRIKGSKLIIDSEGCIKSDQKIKITARLQELTDITIQGSGDIMIPDTFPVKDLTLKINGSGDVNGNFMASHIESVISGSGNITLSGSANSHNIKIDGSGNVKAGTLPCNTSEIHINGSGDIFTYVIEKLKIKLNGSGSVHFKGKPAITTSINGSGKVIDEN